MQTPSNLSALFTFNKHSWRRIAYLLVEVRYEQDAGASWLAWQPQPRCTEGRRPWKGEAGEGHPGRSSR